MDLQAGIMSFEKYAKYLHFILILNRILRQGKFSLYHYIRIYKDIRII